jgi:hypothetical protein
MQDHFIDKTERLHHLLQFYFDGNIGDFQSKPLALVYCRRFAKSTLLKLIQAVFSPMPKLDSYPFDAIKAKIRACAKGPALLEYGMHPVVLLDMSGAEKVIDLIHLIKAALEDAGLDKGTANNLCPIQSDNKVSGSASSFLRRGVRALNEQFCVETGKSSKTILLIDEFDKPYRNIKPDLELLESCRTVYGLCKDKDSGISLFVVAGLTRMAGGGLSDMNTLNRFADISFQHTHHGICGILQSELSTCARDDLEELAHLHDMSFDEMMSQMAVVWNGFCFGIDASPAQEDNALFSPVDVWQLIADLSVGKAPQDSVWLETMQSEFEFINFQKTFTPGSFQLLTKHLGGGWVTSASLRTQLNREDYQTLRPDVVKRVLYELGMLAVKDVQNDMVLLIPPNKGVLENAFRLLLKGSRYDILPSDEEVRKLTSEEGFAKVIDSAAMETTTLYCRSDWVREYAYQDALYLLLLQTLPRLEGRTYEMKAEYGKGQGRMDIRIHHEESSLNCEIKLTTRWTQTGIDNAHTAQLDAAMLQLRSRPPSDSVNWAVSCVWTRDGTRRESRVNPRYHLDVRYQFFERQKADQEE